MTPLPDRAPNRRYPRTAPTPDLIARELAARGLDPADDRALMRAVFRLGCSFSLHGHLVVPAGRPPRPGFAVDLRAPGYALPWASHATSTVVGALGGALLPTLDEPPGPPPPDPWLAELVERVRTADLRVRHARVRSPAVAWAAAVPELPERFWPAVLAKLGRAEHPEALVELLVDEDAVGAVARALGIGRQRVRAARRERDLSGRRCRA